jgi:outer membrane immunogenic protein
MRVQAETRKVMMIRALTLFLLSLFLPRIALAADLPAKRALPVFAAADPTWTGIYVGITAGWIASGTTDNGLWTNNGVPIMPGSDPFGQGTGRTFGLVPYQKTVTSGGLALGVTGGYNYQINSQLVAGLEADISGLALTGSQGSSPNFNALINNNFPNNLPASCIVNCLGQTLTSQWLGLATQRARFGFLINPQWLTYVTGGIAEALVHDRYQTLLTTSNNDNWRVGWVAGLGTEYMLSPNISVKLEGLYVGLGTSSVAQSFLTIPPPNKNNPGIALATRDKFSDGAWIARTGINYKF